MADRRKERYHFNSVNKKSYLPNYPGESPEVGIMSAQRLYSAAIAPTVNHDSSDSAGIGSAFENGDFWHNTQTNIWYTCEDNTQYSAFWNIFALIESIIEIDTDEYSISNNFTWYSVTYTQTGTVILTLPPAENNIGITFTISDSGANAQTNSITINVSGTDTITARDAGETQVIINQNGVVYRFMAIDSSTYKVW